MQKLIMTVHIHNPKKKRAKKSYSNHERKHRSEKYTTTQSTKTPSIDKKQHRSEEQNQRIPLHAMVKPSQTPKENLKKSEKLGRDRETQIEKEKKEGLTKQSSSMVKMYFFLETM